MVLALRQLVAAAVLTSACSVDHGLVSDAVCVGSCEALQRNEVFEEDLAAFANTSLLQVDIHVSNGTNGVVKLAADLSHKSILVVESGELSNRSSSELSSSTTFNHNVALLEMSAASNAAVTGGLFHRAMAQSQLSAGAQSGSNMASLGIVAVIIFLGVLAMWIMLPDDVDKRMKKPREQQPRQLHLPSLYPPGYPVGGAALAGLGGRTPSDGASSGIRTPDVLKSPGRSPGSAFRSIDSTPVGPPPICPSLILPNTQARFVASMDSLTSIRSGTIDFKGTSGRALLHAALAELPGNRRRLTLASTRAACEENPRTTVVTPELTGEPLELYGKNAKYYGTIERGADQMGCTLRKNGQPVMTLEVVAESNMSVHVFAVDGRFLSKAEPTTSKGGELQWAIVVEPGVDAVLVTTCMLTFVLLRPWLSSISGGLDLGQAASDARRITAAVQAASDGRRHAGR